ncbi:hypothetical protein PVK06_040742 [Gossypium arboreum]|uniref:Reverse transcriptase zinc-binding domain-containing protein n=1 Tax=Gossypium arboreum TaxID=29729 RepID=A0ABR0N6X9_GOSAR|nr:hypothetical protein PVK06_040742 [Gossypium arboreum]
MSVVWRGIVENAKDSKVVKWMGNESFRWLVGNGNTDLFWEDICYGDKPLRVEFSRLFLLTMNKKKLVKDFSISNGFNEDNWADFFIRPLFDIELNMVIYLKEVVSSKVLIPDEEDRLIWIHDTKGVFSVKKLTELLIKEGLVDISFAYDNIWKLKVPPRVRSFLWFWCPPSVGWVKFNVCSMEIENKVGCGRVLRDSDRVARALFSRPFAVKDLFVAEVFSWVENKGSRPWLLYTFFKEIEIGLSRVSNVSFSKVDKHGNKMAFALAVTSLKRPGFCFVLRIVQQKGFFGVFVGYCLLLPV